MKHIDSLYMSHTNSKTRFCERLMCSPSEHNYRRVLAGYTDTFLIHQVHALLADRAEPFASDAQHAAVLAAVVRTRAGHLPAIVATASDALARVLSEAPQVPSPCIHACTRTHIPFHKLVQLRRLG